MMTGFHPDDGGADLETRHRIGAAGGSLGAGSDPWVFMWVVHVVVLVPKLRKSLSESFQSTQMMRS